MKGITSAILKMKLTKIMIISLIFTIIGSIHSVYFNESRFILPTDFSTYQFRWEDLIFVVPLFTFVFSACIATIQYPIFLVNRSGISSFRKYKLGEYTPKVPDKLWFLGFFGLIGFVPMIIDLTLNLEIKFSSPYNAVYFVFFSGFSYYFQNKFSDVLVDERFLFNAVKSEAKAYQVAYTIIIFALIIAVPRFSNTTLNVFLLTTIAISYATAEILKSYFQYKYDIEE